MTDNQNLCGHPACQCAVPSGEQYCSDFCREAVSNERKESPFCECGHAACASNPQAGKSGE